MLDFFMSSFSANLRAARLVKQKTIVQCADALGITNPAWNQWETGKREPKYDKLLEICALLDCTPNDLLGVSSPSAITINGNMNAVAHGPGARAVSTSKLPPGELPQCAKCPHRKLAEKMRRIVG